MSFKRSPIEEVSFPSNRANGNQSITKLRQSHTKQIQFILGQLARRALARAVMKAVNPHEFTIDSLPRYAGVRNAKTPFTALPVAA